jgi:hypothetical protein
MPALNDFASLGSKIHHSGTTLAHHLINTWKILNAWKSPAHVCTAGLFHSAYQLLGEPNGKCRDLLRTKLGREAEQVIYYVHIIPAELLHRAAREETPINVCGIDGASYRLDSKLVSAVITVDVASSLDQLLRIEVEAAQWNRERALFANSLYLLPRIGQEVVAEVWKLKDLD